MDVAADPPESSLPGGGPSLRQRGPAGAEPAEPATQPEDAEKPQRPDKPDKPEDEPHASSDCKDKACKDKTCKEAHKHPKRQMPEALRKFLLSKFWKCIVLTIVGFTPIFGLSMAFPTLIQETGSWKVLHWALACWLAAQFLFNFAAAQHTDAGGCSKINPTHGTTGQFEMVLQEVDQDSIDRKDVIQALKYAPSWCEHCKHWKPPRAHHCSFCRRCVMRMDHHCPFTGNCIGFRNQGHFVLMYMFAIVGLSYAVLLIVANLYHGYMFPKDSIYTPMLRRYRFLTGPSGFVITAVLKLLTMTTPGVAVFSFVTVIALAAVLGFGGPAIWLAVTNQTTLETHFPMKEYVQIKPQVYCPLGPGFYHRGWRQNLRDMLGPRWWLRLLLPVKGEPDLHVSLAPRPSTVGAEALLMRVNQVEKDGVQQEVQSVTQLGINPGPPAQGKEAVQNTV